MTERFQELLQRSLIEKSDVIFSKPQFDQEIDFYISNSLVRKLGPTEIAGRIFQYPYKNGMTDLSFEYRNGEWLCEPVDLIGDAFTLPLSDVEIFQLHYKDVFKVIAQNSGFSTNVETLPFLDCFIPVGLKKISGKKNCLDTRNNGI